MNGNSNSEHEFLERLTEITEANLGDEKFGVKELAQLAGITQSFLSHRLSGISGKSVSQFIMEVRLTHAMEILSKGDLTAAETAYNVGFGSTTYFHKCFRAHFGYPPGEVKKRSSLLTEEDTARANEGNNSSTIKGKNKPFFQRKIMVASIALFIVAILALLVFFAFFNKTVKTFGNKAHKISIAVLPFTNLSESPENRYFADGVMEDILSNLNRISSISVTSRTSVEQYRETTKNVVEIARELDVRYILEGSVQRDNDNVRVRVQLIDARRDRHILSETYDRELVDIFFIQSNIAIQVANKLEAALSPEETKWLEEVPTQSTEAYSLYLKGRYFWYKRTKEGFEKSIEYFAKAVEIDPGYALAWAGLGDGYFYISYWNWYDPGRNEGFDMAKKYAMRALELDNKLAEAHVVMGNIYFWYEWNWQEAVNELSLAVKLNPSYYMAHWVYAELLDILCKREEARAHMNRALELDPVLYLLYSTSAFLYFNDGNFMKSIEEGRKAIELDPDYLPPYERVWKSYLYLDSLHQALQYMQMFTKARDNQYETNINSNDSIRIFFNQRGMSGVLHWWTRHYHQQNSLYLSRLFILSGKTEEALNSLEKGYEKHEPDMVRIISVYEFNHLRSEPRYLEIVKKMGLLDYYNKALASGQLPQ